MNRTTQLMVMSLMGALAGLQSGCSSEEGAGQTNPIAGSPPASPTTGAGAAAPPMAPMGVETPPTANASEPAAPAGPAVAPPTGMGPTAMPTAPGAMPTAPDPTAPAAVPAGGAPGVDPSDPSTPFADLPANCRGFEVAGLTHSPGGNVLPNTCAPYDNVLNNPYAIRCIDADSSYDSGYPGDDFCILPPDPELGTQVKVSPESYENPADWFIMNPGEEHNDYFYADATNEEEHYFYRVYLRMRAGSHHMINRTMDADRDDGPATFGDFGGGSFGGSGGGSQSFPGAQRPDEDRPKGLEVPPENAGLGSRLRPHQQFSFNLHHFNLSEGQLLREVWVNIWYKPESEVVDEMTGISIFGNPADLNIPPGEHRELHYACDVQASTRIITINGHRHASTDRFGIWIEKSNGDVMNIYESFDYYDMPTYQFDSITENPAPSVDTKQDGGHSGLLEVGPGDELHFVCDVTNRNATSLRFANEVETGEMCIVFGTRSGGSLCSSARRVQ